MKPTENPTEVVSTDVLIIGGGISGIVSAIKAREHPVDVLIVEKQTTGWSGKANRGGGVLWVLTREDDLDRFHEYHVRHIGHYLNDQELLRAVAAETYGAIEQIEKWGAKVNRNAQGDLDTFKPFPNWSLAAVDLDMLQRLRRTARKAGAKIRNKIQITDLLTHDNRVVGAVGFNILEGRFYVFQAKATILANGSCNYTVLPMWSSGRGDGIAAAYRAGAEMRNAEFGNFYNVVLKGSLAAVIGGQYALYNANGDKISAKYTAPNEPDLDIGILLGMEREVLEGRGPIRLEPSEIDIHNRFLAQFFKWNRPHANDFWTRLATKEFQHGADRSARPEAIPGFIGELSPVKVNHEMRTSLEGLWAVGDTSYGGSAWAGAVPAPPGGVRGSGIMNGVLSALRGAPSAARYALGAEQGEVDSAVVGDLKEALFAPMRHSQGASARDAMFAIREVVSPARYSIRKSEDRLLEALSRIETIQQGTDVLWTKDLHGLMNCIEVKSMALCAEMYFRSALMRKESRGWHYREDYPEQDDRNWLKWIILKQEKGKMVSSTESIPIERYDIGVIQDEENEV